MASDYFGLFLCRDNDGYQGQKELMEKMKEKRAELDNRRKDLGIGVKGSEDDREFEAAKMLLLDQARKRRTADSPSGDVSSYD